MFKLKNNLIGRYSVIQGGNTIFCISINISLSVTGKQEITYTHRACTDTQTVTFGIEPKWDFQGPMVDFIY